MRDDDRHLTLYKFIKHLHCLTGLVLFKQGGRELLNRNIFNAVWWKVLKHLRVLTSFALMRCFRATIRLGMRPRIRFCCSNNEDKALKCVTRMLSENKDFKMYIQLVLVKLSHCLPAPPCQCMRWWQSRLECSSTMFLDCRGPAAQHSAAGAAGSSEAWTAQGWTPSPYSEAGGRSVRKQEFFFF